MNRSFYDILNEIADASRNHQEVELTVDLICVPSWNNNAESGPETKLIQAQRVQSLVPEFCPSKCSE